VVYDVGVDRGHFAFDGPRPFYVLVLGKYGDVEAYLQSLEADELGDNPNAHFLIVSPFAVRGLPKFNKTALRETTQLDSVNELVAPGRSSDYLQQFRVLRGADAAFFRAVTPLELSPYRMSISLKSEDLKPQITVQK